MHGKYVDQRVYQHYVHTYSRVHYLDREIFNVSTDALRQIRRAEERSAQAIQGIQKICERSEGLAGALRESRQRREEDAAKFVDDMRLTQEEGLRKAQLVLSRHEQAREQTQLSHIKDEKYLQNLLRTNSTKAQSRLTSVRRWN